MFTLYHAPCTISIAVAITLEEAGLAYDPVRLDFAQAEQTQSAYRAINPKGRVPALVTPAGRVLTETGALLEYIAALVPDARLIPDDIEGAAHMRGVMYYLASTMHVAHAHGMRGNRWADQQSSFEDMKAKVPQTMYACATYVEANCLEGNYVTGDRFSIADPYLYMLCTWMEGDGVPQDDFPRIKAFFGRMNARDSVTSVRQKGML